MKKQSSLLVEFDLIDQAENLNVQAVCEPIDDASIEDKVDAMEKNNQLN